MAPSFDKQDDRIPRQDSSSGTDNSIPARSHSRPRRSSIPPQPTIEDRTIRLIVATIVGAGVMVVLLMLAVKYAKLDWSRKNKRARTEHAIAASTNTLQSPTVVEAPPSWTYELQPAATERQMARLTSDRFTANAWLILARGLSDKTDPEIVISCLRMAMAGVGENAEMKNDLGAVYLQQKRIKEARAQFQAADQIHPGFAPARFNLALCAISDRTPEKAIQWLGQYLGQRPSDTTALRLQSTLLSQFGRPQEALRLLEKFLKNQPAHEPLFLEAALLAARLGQNGNAIRYLETAMNGNTIQSVVRAYQSPIFREIRLSGDGEKLSALLADKARAVYSTPVPADEIQPLRAITPEAKIR